jgi:hypothetical protein
MGRKIYCDTAAFNMAFDSGYLGLFSRDRYSPDI